VRLVERAASDPTWGLEFEDETWFVWVPPEGVMNPEAGQGWSPSGQPPRNRASRKKGKETFNCYGSLDRKENRVHWEYFEAMNQWTTAIYLNARIAAHEALGHRVLVLAWDPAPWHLGKQLRAWIRRRNQRVKRTGEGVRVLLVVLPKGAFWLDPVDALIKHAKGRALPCRQFPDQQAQRRALDRHWLHRNLHLATVPKPEDFFVHLH
jgi:hypothetical protein